MTESRPSSSRRAVLAATAGLASAGGCLGRASSGSTVSLLAAGSLQNALTGDFRPPTDARVEVEAHGSARAARMVAEGQRDPDIIALADPVLFSSPLDTAWYATFANNAIVLTYNPETAGGKRVQGAETWFAPLLRGDVRLGRTDPDLDPLGYRTLFTLALAADHYDTPALADRLLSRTQIYPETQLLAQFDSGSVDAAFVYRSMAVERGYPYVDLPAAVDMSDPDHAASYASMSYTLPGGTVVRGTPIQYAATCRTQTEAATTVFDAVVESSDQYLESHGFTVTDRHPHYSGDVPTSQ